MLLSLAGIPLTMGFVGKFYVACAGVGASLWLLVIVLVIGSVIGLFYTLRIIAMMAAPLAPAGAPPSVMRAPARAACAALAALVLALLGLGIYPAPLMRVLQATLALSPALAAPPAK